MNATVTAIAVCLCAVLLCTAGLQVVRAVRELRALWRAHRERNEERQRRRRAAQARKELHNFMSYDGSEQR